MYDVFECKGLVMESSVIITCLVVLGNSKGNEVVLGFVKKA